MPEPLEVADTLDRLDALDSEVARIQAQRRSIIPWMGVAAIVMWVFDSLGISFPWAATVTAALLTAGALDQAIPIFLLRSLERRRERLLVSGEVALAEQARDAPSGELADGMGPR